MKITSFFQIFLGFILFLISPYTLLSQDDSKYPIEISDINLPANYWEPQILMSATVMAQDYYIITLRVQNNADYREIIYVQPFTEGNFIRSLRRGRKELMTKFNRENEDKNIAEIETSKKDSIAKDNTVDNLLSSPPTQYERSLFYQLKGSEIATPVGYGRPIAGNLCFSSNVVVQKKLDAFNRLKAEGLLNNDIKSEWREYLLDTNQDTLTKFSKNEYAAMRKRHEANNIRKNNAQFLMTTRRFKEKSTQIFYAESNLIDHINELESEYSRLYNNVKYDKTIDTTIREQFLDSVSMAYKSSRMPNMLNYRKRGDAKDPKFDILYDNNNAEQLWEFVSRPTVLLHIQSQMDSSVLNELKSELTELRGSLLPALSSMSSFEFKIKYVELEFNEGFIENILVVGQVTTLDLSKFYDEQLMKDAIYGEDTKSTLNEFGMITKQIKFENRYPLGFSRKSDYANLGLVKLTSNGKNDEERYTLELGDLLTIYLPKHEVGRRDFSPENKVIIYDPLSGDDCITLYKEETSKLFEARVFSDFVGLDEKAANGLLQTEIAKRLNLNTSRVGDFGFLSWIEPTITLSKIEQNNRDLKLNQLVPNDTTGRNRFYAASLDIRRHESLSVGTRLNAFYFDFPQIKSTISANGSIYYGRTPIRTDTMSGGINTLTLSPEVVCDIRADERWGLALSWRWNYMKVKSRDIVQVSDLVDPNNLLVQRVRNYWYNTAQFQVFFQPSEDNRGRLFFRYRYHWQYGDQNLGFHQAQVGYSFYLLGRNKGTEKSK